MKFKKFYNKDKGITLVALVVTVIVLIILASISLSYIFKLDLFGITLHASMNYTESQSEEVNELYNLNKKVDKQLGNIQEEVLTAAIVSFTPENTEWTVQNVKEALDYLYNN